MPYYVYECDAGHETQEYRSVADWSSTTACDCGRLAHQRITLPAIHTLGTFSGSINDRVVQASRDPGDGSYFDPNLCDKKTGKPIRIRDRKHRETVMRELGVFEKPPCDMASDADSIKRRKPKSFSATGSRA